MQDKKSYEAKYQGIGLGVGEPKPYWHQTIKKHNGWRDSEQSNKHFANT